MGKAIDAMAMVTKAKKTKNRLHWKIKLGGEKLEAWVKKTNHTSFPLMEI